MDGLSLNLTDERLQALRALMPDVFSENKIDFDRLRQALDPDAFAPPEHYELTWAGKADARREIQRQTTATLTPDRDQSIDFDTTQHVFIEGENLDVLRTLQRAYFGKVKMIYIDPPYNTGNDSFVYPDDYAERLADYRQRAGLTDENGYLNKQDLWRTNRRENGQFHSAWMSMMYPRLFLARNLLREDGVIFVSIDDNEVSNLKGMMNEIFGEENLVDCIVWKKRYGGGAKEKYLVNLHEYILMYAKSKENINPIFIENNQEFIGKYYTKKDKYFETRGPYRNQPLEAAKSMGERKNLVYGISGPNGITISPKRQWLWSKERVINALEKGELEFNQDKEGSWSVSIKQYLRDEDGIEKTLKVASIIEDIYTQHGSKEIEHLFGTIDYFPYPKPSSLIKLLLKFSTNLYEDDLILDFFAGSATTAHAVLELNAEDGGNRRFVLVQLPEPTDPKTEARKAGYDTIADIGRARVRRVIDRMNAEIGTLQTTIGNLHERIAANETAIVEFSANTPQLFDGANPPKPLLRLQEEADRLQQSLATATEKLTRLQTTDKGFRAFRLAPSNMKVWQTETNNPDVAQLLIDYIRSDKEGAESERMLFEFLLKKGYPLTAHIETLDLDGIRAYSVEGGQMLVLLDGYNQAINDRIIDTHPRHVVCLDRLFAGNDEALTNLHLDLRDRDIELTVI